MVTYNEIVIYYKRLVPVIRIGINNCRANKS